MNIEENCMKKIMEQLNRLKLKPGQIARFEKLLDDFIADNESEKQIKGGKK